MMAYEFHLCAEVGLVLDQETIVAIDDDQARTFGEIILLCSDDAAFIEIHPPQGPVITLRRESLCS